MNRRDGDLLSTSAPPEPSSLSDLLPMEGHGRRQPGSGWFRPRSGRVDVLNVVVGFGSALYRRREPNGALVGEQSRCTGSSELIPAVLGRGFRAARSHGFVSMVPESATGAQTRWCSLDVVGSSVNVHCQTAGETFTDAGADLGYVAFGSDGVPETKTTIKWEQCRALASFTRSGGIRPSRDEMIAVHVLTHESMHMSGIGSEVASECRAMQRDARMARLLGAGRSDARYLASW